MTKKRKVFSFNSQLYMVTGVQRVLMDIHRAVRDDYDARVVGTVPYERVHSDIGLSRAEYVCLRNPLMFRGAIVIVHERKFLALFWLLNHVLFQRIKIVYVHHNVFSDHRRLSVMPRTVVAISDSGVRNLTDFFRVPLGHIHKIHNCVADDLPVGFERKYYGDGVIKVLYPARITLVKRQCEIVRQLQGKLSDRIKVVFAGTSALLPELKELTDGDSHFVVLGYSAEVHKLMRECDYTMLFSTKEGLSITLIEAAMSAMPIICNDVGGNTEIAHDGCNAFVRNDWENLTRTLNSLGEVSESDYLAMCRNSRSVYERLYTFDTFKHNYLALLGDL